MTGYKSLKVEAGIPKSFDFEYQKENEAPQVFSAKFQPPSNGISIKVKADAEGKNVSILHASFHKSMETLVDNLFTSKEGVVSGFVKGQKVMLHRPVLKATSVRLETGEYVVKQYSAGYGETIVS